MLDLVGRHLADLAPRLAQHLGHHRADLRVAPRRDATVMRIFIVPPRRAGDRAGVPTGPGHPGVRRRRPQRVAPPRPPPHGTEVPPSQTCDSPTTPRASGVSLDRCDDRPEGRRMLRVEARNAATPIEKKPEWIRTRARAPSTASSRAS